MNEEGTVFRSYYDGTTINLTPESTVRAQKQLGADIIIPLDELPPYHVSRERLAASVALSHRWEARSLAEHLADPREQAMYCVVHGGVDRELRAQSVAYLASLPFDGFAIGGSLGKDRAEMVEMLTWLMPQLPDDGRPNHLLGIADDESIAAVVPLGVDTLDSCNPTRVGRHGTLLTREGPIRIGGTKYAEDFGPIDPAGLGFEETGGLPYSRSYVHHLKQNDCSRDRRPQPALHERPRAATAILHAQRRDVIRGDVPTKSEWDITRARRPLKQNTQTPRDARLLPARTAARVWSEHPAQVIVERVICRERAPLTAARRRPLCPPSTPP